MGAERDRVAEFGKLENGLRQTGDWYRWGEDGDIIRRRYGLVRSVGEVVMPVTQQNRT